ncbi:MAG: helix-turn-helix domain-containing protein [Planctomycetes bacterium]|nr:helix-turn-helix domain-containing protein [Planctomycetota bacterium]
MVQSVTRALTLLNEVAHYPDGVGVRQLSRDVGLKVPTAQALLKTLAGMGFLDFDLDKRSYRIGFAVMGLAGVMNNKDRFQTLCQDAINEMVDEYKESAFAGSLQGHLINVICSACPDNPLAVVHKESLIERPHRLAIGKVLLAYQDDDVINTYLDRDNLNDGCESENINRDELLAQIRQVRNLGYGEAIDVCGHGIDAFAVPVFDKQNKCQISIGCSAPISRISPRKRTLMLARLFEHAEYISEQYYGVRLDE